MLSDRFGRIFHHKGYSVIKKRNSQRIRRRFSSLENFQFFLGRYNFLEIKNMIAEFKKCNIRLERSAT